MEIYKYRLKYILGSDCVISLKKSHGVCYGIFNADFDENQTNFNMQKE